MSAAPTIARFVPTGNLLAPEVFASRHRLLVRILLGHVPVLYVVGLLRGFDPLLLALEVLPALLAAGAASLGGASRSRLRAVLVTAGLSWTSIVLVHVTGGQIESHFHFFIVLGFIALYQDWLPFTWYIGFTALSHGLGSGVVPDLVFNHAAGQANPWLWSGVHAAGVALLSIGLIIFWSNTEAEQRRATSLATELSAKDLQRARADIEQRQAQSQMLLNLARRNQSLVQRQLDTIEELETDEQRPDVLDRLFSLDHMSTRMRRNAESLLVLSGAEPARIWREPVPLSDVLRAAISEVEEYRRIDLLLGEDPSVEGRAAADLSHLFAELVENATASSPPSTRATVSAEIAPSRDLFVVVRDHGVGMDEATLADARALLGSASDGSGGRAMTPGDARLGLQVVGALARRHGLTVDVQAGAGGTAVQVVVPASLVVAEAVVEPAFAPGGPGRRAQHAVPAQGGSPTPAGPDLWAPAAQPVASPVAQPVAPPVAPPVARPVPEYAASAARPAAVTDQPPAPAHAGSAFSAYSAFTSRQGASVSADAPAGDGLPDLPRRSRADDVSTPAPVDLWATGDGGDQS
ncbi:ATP-binding protein [Jannaschia sp. R86511]|uniref:sensor histidine kinase n=1 Tax=Jannaschia sp. R86511 TaxID=3093853 RepID=UPI0036D3DDA3